MVGDAPSANPVVRIPVLSDGTAAELCGCLRISKRRQGRIFSQGLLRRLVNGGEHPVRKEDLVRTGESLVLQLERTREPGPASDEPVEVAWRDDFALVANKPAGLLVHGDGSDAPALTARVQGLLNEWNTARSGLRCSTGTYPAAGSVPQAGSVPTPPVAQAINRLDVDTSGLVLFSLTEELQPAFDALVASHDPALILKRYLCVVRGTFPAKPQLIDAAIARDRHDARRMRVGATGKAAHTLVARLDCRGGFSLLACELRTGRKHQIRVHLAHVGHPVVGDALYGGRGEKPGSLMLHAAALEFVHPVTRERVSLYTDWPVRFASLFSSRAVDWSILGP